MKMISATSFVYRVFCICLLSVSGLFANTQVMINDEEGVFRCAGGAQAYTLAENCKRLTLNRVVVGSGVVYEGRCLDRNDKDHQFSCLTYTFTHQKRIVDKEDFWTKSKKNKQ